MARVHTPRQQVAPEIRRLLDLAELPESMLTKSELAELDAWIAAETAEIRAGWLPEQEAAARRVRFKPKDKHITTPDGRVFNTMPVQRVDTNDLVEGVELVDG